MQVSSCEFCAIELDFELFVTRAKVTILTDFVCDNKFINHSERKHESPGYIPKTPIKKTIFLLSIFKNIPHLHSEFRFRKLGVE